MVDVVHVAHNEGHGRHELDTAQYPVGHWFMHWDWKRMTDWAQLVHVDDLFAQVTQGAVQPVH